MENSSDSAARRPSAFAAVACAIAVLSLVTGLTHPANAQTAQDPPPVPASTTTTAGATGTDAAPTNSPPVTEPATPAQPAPATEATGGAEANPTVTNGDDAGPGSYRAAIAAASAHAGDDVITFDPDLEVSLAADVIYTGSDHLTLVGNGSGITGNDSHQILSAPSALSVTVDGLRLREGLADRGPAIDSAGPVNATDSEFFRNTATDHGGAIATAGDGASVTVVGGALFENVAGINGGAVFTDGTDAPVSIEDASLTSNQAGVGGAIATIGNLSPIEVEASDVSMNEADRASEGDGGALYTLEFDSGVTISSSVLRDNTSNDDGGAVYTRRSTSPVTVTQSVLVGNNTVDQGGGIYTTSGGVAIDTSTLVDNSAGDSGGAIDVGGQLSLVHATLAQNGAPAGAGLQADQHLTSQASVLTDPVDDDNCTIVGATTSVGDNYDTDGSCGFGSGPRDVSGGPDPLLSPLRFNGDTGSDPTSETAVARASMFPLLGSPLIDSEPAATCAAHPVDTDQRGVDRPFGDGCEIGAIENVFPAHAFTDVTPFYEAAVRWVSSDVNDPQILLGYPDDTFGQSLNITRGQAARLYYRGAGAPDVSDLPPHGFPDVTPFYEDAVTWAKANGVFDGFPDNTFRQSDPIRRGNFVRSLYAVAGAPDVSDLPPHGFNDVTPFYEDAVTWAKANTIVLGFGDNTFRQDNNIKRGNAARTFYATAQSPDAWDDPDSAPPAMLFRPETRRRMT